MNKFGEEFINLINNAEQPIINFPKEKRINIIDKDCSIPIVELTFENFTNGLIHNCFNIAVEKAKKTMPQDQAGNIRLDEIKVINQFRGILAETIVHLFLYYKCDINIKNIYRYDLERETFDYKPEEYDIKLKLCNNVLEVEVRSSNNPWTDISQYLLHRGVLAIYTNDFKKTEAVKDISFAVIYDLINHKGPLDEYTRKKFFEDFKNNKYKIYLITHCATKDAFELFGEITNLGQGKTQYIQVPFSTISDKKYHIKNIIAKFLNRGLEND